MIVIWKEQCTHGFKITPDSIKWYSYKSWRCNQNFVNYSDKWLLVEIAMKHNSIARAWRQHMWHYLSSCHNMQERLVPARLQGTNTMSTDKELLCQPFLESCFITFPYNCSQSKLLCMLIWSKVVEFSEKDRDDLEEIVKFIWRWLFQYAAPFWKKKNMFKNICHHMIIWLSM